MDHSIPKIDPGDYTSGCKKEPLVRMATIPPKNLCLFEPMWKKARRVCIIGADVEETSLWFVRENSGHGDKDISLSGDETFWGATQYTGRAGVRDSTYKALGRCRADQ